jgi:hypothetical protein
LSAAFGSFPCSRWPSLLHREAGDLTPFGANHHSTGSLNAPLQAPRASPACRHLYGCLRLTNASLLDLRPDVELGRLWPAQGAVVRKKSRTTSPRACRPSSPSQANSSRHRRVRGRRSNPLPLALSAALYHILTYTPSFLTAQFVLLLTAQGLAERWGGWPCSWVALAMPAPAAARPWPQLWLGRSIPDGLRSLSGPPSPPRNRHVGVSRGC